MYKVFFKDRIFSLTDETYLEEKNANTYIFKDDKQLKSLIFDFLHNKSDYCLVHESAEKLWEIFKECFEIRHAAGGLVIKDKSFLAIKRWNIWDLPKGHIEEGESEDIAAIREVEEETGISNPIIKKQLEDSLHIYIYEGKLILKINHWFKMSYEGNEKLIPQVEEDITEAIWMPINNKSEFIMNTYPTLLPIINDL
jgi:8-oxo-dGTP pyrophosphatase MutT (NUDIX family)